MMTSPNKSLEKLKAKQKQLQNKIQHMKAKVKEALRKKEMRRKIIVGEFILQKARRENTLTQLIAQLAPHLTRKGDRELFGLDKSLNQIALSDDA
jgi:hypothetical protein